MEKTNLNNTTAFAEVFASPGKTYQQNRAGNNDNRMMIYFQGMKLYIPDGFQPDSLLKLLQVLRKL